MIFPLVYFNSFQYGYSSVCPLLFKVGLGMNWEVSQISANTVSEPYISCSCRSPPHQTKIPERSIFLSMSTQSRGLLSCLSCTEKDLLWRLQLQNMWLFEVSQTSVSETVVSKRAQRDPLVHFGSCIVFSV